MRYCIVYYLRPYNEICKLSQMKKKKKAGNYLGAPSVAQKIVQLGPT